MNDEPLQHFDPTPDHGQRVRQDQAPPTAFRPRLNSMLAAIPPSDKELMGDADHGIAAAAISAALKHSEARRDAVLAVSLAIKRRGGNPVTDWSTKDVDTAYAIADQLIALQNT